MNRMTMNIMNRKIILIFCVLLCFSLITIAGGSIFYFYQQGKDRQELDARNSTPTQ